MPLHITTKVATSTIPSKMEIILGKIQNVKKKKWKKLESKNINWKKWNINY